jgi:hypothetical protein
MMFEVVAEVTVLEIKVRESDHGIYWFCGRKGVVAASATGDGRHYAAEPLELEND